VIQASFSFSVSHCTIFNNYRYDGLNQWWVKWDI